MEAETKLEFEHGGYYLPVTTKTYKVFKHESATMGDELVDAYTHTMRCDGVMVAQSQWGCRESATQWADSIAAEVTEAIDARVDAMLERERDLEAAVDED